MCLIAKVQQLAKNSQGYIAITDFGIAKHFQKGNAYDTSGTPGYMAPEVILSQDHSFSVDFYAIGVIGYELILGKRPHAGRSRKDVKEQILAKQACIKPNELPVSWSVNAADFINKVKAYHYLN